MEGGSFRPSRQMPHPEASEWGIEGSDSGLTTVTAAESTTTVETASSEAATTEATTMEAASPQIAAAEATA